LLLNTLPENTILLAILIFLAFSKSKFIKKMSLIYINKIISNVFFFCSLSYLFILFESPFKPIFFFNYYFFIDYYIVLIKILILISTFFFLHLISFYIDNYSRDKGVNLIEFPVLIAFSVFFMLYLVSSIDFFGAYICLEGLTFSLYILAGMNFVSQNSIEATIKYFCLGSLASGFLLFGISLIFLITNTLNFIELHYFFSFYNFIINPPLLLVFAVLFVFIGFWFKLSIFPCHS
jgi:NADH-quinone oxidoreductase subunit N